MKKLLLIASVFAVLVACKSEKSEEGDASEGVQIGAKKSSTSKADLKVSMENGQDLYTSLCVACHMANGEGVKGAFPPLAGSDWLVDKRAESIHSVKYGQQGEIVVNGETYNGVMAPLGLSDKEVADVLNYVMNSWGNTQDKMVTEEEVKSVQK